MIPNIVAGGNRCRRPRFLRVAGLTDAGCTAPKLAKRPYIACWESLGEQGPSGLRGCPSPQGHNQESLGFNGN